MHKVEICGVDTSGLPKLTAKENEDVIKGLYEVGAKISEVGSKITEVIAKMTEMSDKLNTPEEPEEIKTEVVEESEENDE